MRQRDAETILQTIVISSGEQLPVSPALACIQAYTSFPTLPIGFIIAYLNEKARVFLQ